MPRIINSNAYADMEIEIDTLFYQVYKHDKRDRQDTTFLVQSFLDKFSESLVSHCRQLFNNVREEDVIYYKSKDKRKGAYSLDPLSDYAGALQLMVTTLIAGQEDPTKRAFYYEMFIQLMNSCYRKGDLTSATAIWIGLRSHNLGNYVDMKRISAKSRLLWQECDVELDRINSPVTTLIAHEELRRKFKAVLIPSLNPLIQIQANCKEVYDDRLAQAQEKLKEIEPKLRELDREMHRLLNQLQLDNSIWSQEYYDYMSTVYLAQCQFEYSCLLREYDECLGYPGVAKEFHKDQNAEHLVRLLDRCFQENRELKISPPDGKVLALLDEVEEFNRTYPGDITLDLYDLVKENCHKVKARNISKYTSKIMEGLKHPRGVPVIGYENGQDPETVEYIQPTYDGIKLMKELYDAIEAHEPKVTVEIPVGRMHCGFFKDIPNAPAVEEGLVLQNQDMQPIGYDLDDFQVPVVQVPS
ncbi:RasGEF domain-containing protein [Legionella sp. 29fVS95]|uniref:RasGEF domain-containing protein n=1 Tax=Legionella sp. 29fVS95 TaxID=3402813 RepID=UPI003AF4E0ED